MSTNAWAQTVEREKEREREFFVPEYVFIYRKCEIDMDEHRWTQWEVEEGGTSWTPLKDFEKCIHKNAKTQK